MGIIDKDMLSSAESGTRRAGKAQYIKYLKGGRVPGRQAIAAKCYDCDGMGETGECDIQACALYPYSPYRSKSKV